MYFVKYIHFLKRKRTVCRTFEMTHVQTVSSSSCSIKLLLKCLRYAIWQQNARKNGKRFNTAPLQCPLLHLPHSVAACSEEPNFNYFPTITLFISRSIQLCFFLTSHTGLVGQYVTSTEDIQQKTTVGLTATPKEDFQRRFQQQQGFWS
jgi:hypothetical protein